jgi:hypothetical protein
MDNPHIPEMPDPPEPEPHPRGGNTLWVAGKLAMFLAAVSGYFKFSFLSIIVLVNMLAIAEFMRFLFNRKTYIGWQGYVGLVFTSTLFCSMAYGAGRLVAYIWPAA